ncbi:hypothetical protein KSP40_PGU017089 [Platanthera guangdongensis]|uniref:Uncharacterized protein n=1 Tax=Platanthera guangdongensis TaxID=2320717 RepID=A0ABR2MAY8_9ASPA
MTIGVFNPLLSAPWFPPLLTAADKLSLGRWNSQAASITAFPLSLKGSLKSCPNHSQSALLLSRHCKAKKQVRDAKFLPASNALLLKNSAECMVGETTDHIGLNLCCGGHDAVIYGYWMGPDLEDGWGFLVASVIQR